MGLKKNLLNETVKNLPLREAITMTEDTVMTAVLDRMREKHLGCVIVVDADGKPLGTFTERAMIDLLARDPAAWESMPVGKCLEKEWFSVQLTTPISHVMDLIREHAVRFVCVTDEAGHPVGLTGQKGLSEYIADHFPRQVMVQRLGGKPGTETREGA